MFKTIDSLFNACFNDDINSITNGVIYDYFGIHNNNYITIIFGLYVGLIKIKQISKELIENCFYTNRLDELIHKKYKNWKSQYYNIFCNNNIIIGKTYINKTKKITMLNIDDDDDFTIVK